MYKYILSLVTLIPVYSLAQMNSVPSSNPIDNPANKMAMAVRATGANMDISVQQGPCCFGDKAAVLFVDLGKLPPDQYKDKQLRDSIINASKFLYIEDALQQGCQEVRFFISKKAFLGGADSRTYTVLQLLDERRKARSAMNK